jgi:CheY-like chemotaxis protein
MEETRVLVVDNEKDLLSMMKTIIERLGPRVFLAHDAKTAMGTLRREAIAIVILDLIMPDMDGTDLCEKIKQEFPDTLVYAFSGHMDLFSHEKLVRVGFDGCIQKPLSISTIEKIITAAAYKGEENCSGNGQSQAKSPPASY